MSNIERKAENALENVEEKLRIFHSGEQGTTGREPFEGSSATGPAAGLGQGSTGHSGLTGNHEHSGLTGSSGSSGLTGSSGQHHTGSNLASGIGAGVGAGALASSATHGQHDHSHDGHIGGHDSSRTGDRVGDLGQSSAAYERTGPGGPATSGAAGTDRFDTDKHHGSTAGGLGQSGHDSHSHSGVSGYNDSNTKGSGGGLMGILGTSDKDFTANRDRVGTGAYNDDTGHFKGNTSGPAGNTALTGREGNNIPNPVSGSSGITGNSTATGAHGAAHPGTTAHGVAADSADHHKKGIMEKIKEIL